MTATSPAVPAAAPTALPPAHRVGFGHLMLAEWTKIRSVRSTVWTLLLFVVLTVGFTALFTWLTASNWTSGNNAATRDATIAASPVGFILGAGIGLGQLTICVLGVLVITSEYSTGVIRSSLLAVPKRLHMLAAKAVVFALLIAVIAEIIAFTCFFVGSAILHSHVPVAIGDQNVLRAVLGAGLYLAVLGLFALSVGLLIRHTAAGITTVIGAVLVLPILSGLLPGSWGAHINAYLPEQAGSLVYSAHRTSDQLLSAWQGFGVFCLWTAVLLAAGAYLLRRRDA
jgi:ABC-2 type transport system permease protein